MAIIDVSGNVDSGTTVLTTPEHKVCLPTSIVVHNRSGVNRTVFFRDTFTPSASNGTASPVSTARRRLEFVVPGGDTNVSFNESDLKGIVFLGVVDASTNIGDASINIAFGYKLR